MPTCSRLRSPAARRPAATTVTVAVVGILALAGCGDDATGPAGGGEEQCGPFEPWDESLFVLPYPPGESYEVDQGNCSGFGHSGFWKHGYDFIMPIGTAVTASRAGEVGWARDGCPDWEAACTNLITVIHEDGLASLYSHLTEGGVLVSSGDIVEAGDTIGESGVTGNTGGLPHLHFSVHPCNELPGLPNAGNCPTVAITFANTDPNPEGLVAGRFYPALPF